MPPDAAPVFDPVLAEFEIGFGGGDADRVGELANDRRDGLVEECAADEFPMQRGGRFERLDQQRGRGVRDAFDHPGKNVLPSAPCAAERDFELRAGRGAGQLRARPEQQPRLAEFAEPELHVQPASAASAALNARPSSVMTALGRNM